MKKESLMGKIKAKIRELFCHHDLSAYPNGLACAISCQKCGKTKIIKT